MADVIILSGTHINQSMASRPVTMTKMRPIFRTAGPYVIAHQLRKNNISVQVIDYIQFLSDTQLISLIKKFLPKDKNKSCILGISTTFLQPVDHLLPSNVVDAIKNIKLESIEDKKTKQINEEFDRIKSLIGYNQKTQ